MSDSFAAVSLPSMKVRQKRLCQSRLKPRADPVYNDTTNFGVRMLEKLGWSAGKGLGKREDGMAVPILPKVKQDIEGFGYAGEKDDHWTQHDQDFNQLLKTLNGDEVLLEDVDLKNLQSIEEKSKNSKTRVHYKKFTRGKDLTNASSKDLANIFGKRSLDQLNGYNQTPKQNTSLETNDKAESIDTNILGLTTINASMSLNEYFKCKMQEKLQGCDETQKNGFIKDESTYLMQKKTKKPCKEASSKDFSIETKSAEYRNFDLDVLPPRKVKVPKLDMDKSSVYSTKSKKKKKVNTEPEIEESVLIKEKKQNLNTSNHSNTCLTDEQIVTEGLSEKKCEPPCENMKGKNFCCRASENAETLKEQCKETDDKSDEISYKVCADVLIQLDEMGFPGSNFADIVGYGLTQDVKLLKKGRKINTRIERHEFMRKKETSFKRKRQMLKNVTAFEQL